MAAGSSDWQLALAHGEPRPDRPALIPLRSDAPTNIGRESADVDAFLDSTAFPKLISRLHCRITVDKHQFVLQDCSVNGCSVDGSVQKRAVLTEGCMVTLGCRGSATEFVYQLQRKEEEKEEEKKEEEKEEEESKAEREDDGEGAGTSKRARTASPVGGVPAPLGAEELNDIQVEELQCCICRELLCRPHALRCSHTFCGGCIFQWAKREQSCPICRDPLVPTAPPLQVRPLDALAHRLAVKALADDERADWEQRRADWDAQAETARQAWAVAPEKAPARQLVPEQEMVELSAGRAPSDRSTCRRCLRRISQGELRAGVLTRVPMFGHSFVAWHHVRCVRLPGGAVVPPNAQVRGLADLPPDEQARVREAFGLPAPQPAAEDSDETENED